MSEAAPVIRLTGRWGAADRGSVGGKAVGLAALLRAGLPVPRTWLVPVGAEPDAARLAPLAAHAARWAVRSSATVEDDAALSYAGMFRSELDVPTNDLPAAIGRVRASAASERVRAYREVAGATGHEQGRDVAMAVLLQPYRTPLRSGVWLGAGEAEGLLEWVSGSGERLVSGVVTPEWEEWTPDGMTRGSGAEVLTADGGEPVGAACLAVQRALGVPADLEFAVLDTGLTWLQFRPVTAAFGRKATDVPGEGAHVRGAPASSGTATGRALLLHGTEDPRWEPGSVLLVERTDPDWVPLMAEAAALVTAEGGMLCHAAIVARELGVPCVTGVGSPALRRLAAGGSVHVDGAAGLVSVRDTADATNGRQEG